jgi:hypothetical protein
MGAGLATGSFGFSSFFSAMGVSATLDVGTTSSLAFFA